MKNLVLIGMPGSGKTSVGQLMAQELGLPFCDTDTMVEQAEGRTISAIFSQSGEPYFRDLEHAAACQAAQHSGWVIATGGGIVLRPENMAALSATGVIIFLDRTPQEIAQDDHGGRPLIGDDRQRVFQLYRTRISLYRQYAQYTLPSGLSPQRTAQELLIMLREKGELQCIF